MVRLATPGDAAAICALIHELAEYEKRTQFCEVTPQRLISTLWALPPFQGPTVLILEVLLPKGDADQSLEQPRDEEVAQVGRSREVQANGFQAVTRELKLNPSSGLINDPAWESFRPSGGEVERRSTVAGYVLLFPNYPSFLATPCLYIEDLYVRQPYRGHGLGTLLLKTVAAQAVQQGAGRVEWTVLDWNATAIKFYEGIGADLIPHEWRHCHLAGNALHSFGSTL